MLRYLIFNEITIIIDFKVNKVRIIILFREINQIKIIKIKIRRYRRVRNLYILFFIKITMFILIYNKIVVRFMMKYFKILMKIFQI